MLDVFLGDVKLCAKDVVGIEFRISKLDVRILRMDYGDDNYFGDFSTDVRYRMYRFLMLRFNLRT